MAAHSIPNMFISYAKILQTMNAAKYCFRLQSQCAKEGNAEYIITRNVGDYSESEIKAILPADFLGLMKAV